jgi:hypothetical protein
VAAGSAGAAAMAETTSKHAINTARKIMIFVDMTAS